MLVIALTGGIASGKTLVSDTFAELGAPIVDADVLAREAVAPGSEGLNALVQMFGENILDDDATLNRSSLRQIIFNDPDARAKVDGLLHPLIRKNSENQIQSYEGGNHPYLIYAIPLLIETGQVERFNRIAVVDVPVSFQLERLMARDDTSEEDAQKIIDSQASREARLAIADDVIDNSGTIENTKKQVRRLHQLYCQ